MGNAMRPNERWRMDFMHDRLADGSWFRVLTVVDQFSRECSLLFADQALNGGKGAAALNRCFHLYKKPVSITVDNGSEFASRTLEAWAYQRNIQLDLSALANLLRTATWKVLTDACSQVTVSNLSAIRQSRLL